MSSKSETYVLQTQREPIPRQMPSGSYEKIESAFSATKTTVTTVFATSLVTGAIFGLSTAALWPIVNAQQILVHTPIFNVVFPANA